MASQRIVLIASLDDSALACADVAQRLAQGWTSGAPPCLKPIYARDLHPDSLQSADAVVLIAQPTTAQSTALAVLDVIEESGTPVLALLDAWPESENCFEFAGAAVDCQSSSDERLSSLLLGLIHRQQEVKRLRAEIALSTRFQGGLKGQVAKIHEELQLAALVQREFLPREMPYVHGVDFAALWRPTNYVSGDIYDLIRLDEDHVGVFIADAVGHGVPAALMTMVICRSLVTKEITGNTYRIVPPGEVLSRLNLEMIRRQGHTTRFATASYAVVNCRRRTAQLAGAGHPPPVRLSANGVTQILETTGGLLGVFPDESYGQMDVELEFDDRLLFYTDGFEQAFPAKQSEPFDRRLPSNQYRNEFDHLGRLGSAAEIIDAISHRLDDQTGSLHQIDDLTLICLHAGQLTGTGDGEAQRTSGSISGTTSIHNSRSTGAAVAGALPLSS